MGWSITGSLPPEFHLESKSFHTRPPPKWMLPFGGFPKLGGTILGGPYVKDYGILGAILVSPHFGKLHFF